MISSRLNSVMALGIFCLLIGLATLAPDYLAKTIPQFFSFVALFSLLGLLGFSTLRKTRLKYLSAPPSMRTVSSIRTLSCLAIVQGALFAISIVFFYTLEHMTQINPRLPALETGQIFQLIQTHWLNLGLTPWLLYSMMGVGIAFFSVRTKTQPLFSEIIIQNPEKKSIAYFVRNYFRVATEAVMFAPFIWLLILCIVWLCEGLNTFFGFPSLFALPFRSITIVAILMVFFYKSHAKLLNWASERRIPLGGILALYCITFTFFIFWLHGIGSWFIFGLENTNTQQIQKSIWLSNMPASTLETRLTFLVWSWWGIWTPWMASMIARLSLGKSVAKALLLPIIFPLMLFSMVHFLAQENHWSLFHDWAEKSLSQWIIGGGLLAFILIAFSHMQTRSDISRGGMIDLSSIKIKPEPMKKWTHMLIVMVACYFPGVFILGWIPMQVINTLASFAMATIIIGVLWRLIVYLFSENGHILDFGVPAKDK
jgi:choline-glycine betaine transporter